MREKIINLTKNLYNDLKEEVKELYEKFKEKVAEDFFIRPSFGIWVGNVGGYGNKNGEKKSGEGYGILGDWTQYIKSGILSGAIIGYGKRFGIATGLIGGIALYPLLGYYNFVGIPLMFTYKRKVGIGIIIPYQTEWYIAVLAALGGFILGLVGEMRMADCD